jgi:hypothetical protein
MGGVIAIAVTTFTRSRQTALVRRLAQVLDKAISVEQQSLYWSALASCTAHARNP